MTKCKQGDATQLRQRIEGSLKIHCKPKDKEFWFGFLVGLVDHQVIAMPDYRRLRDNIDGWKCKRR